MNPDIEYKNLTQRSNPPYEQIIEFIKKEALSCVTLKNIIDQCNSDEYYNDNIQVMIELAQDIRTTTLNSMQSSYSIFQITKRKYISKLRNEIKR